MHRRPLRGLVVPAVFLLLAVLDFSHEYLIEVGIAPPPSKPPEQITFWTLFVLPLRDYLAWALVTPGILWLGRRVPVVGPRWLKALGFHAATAAVLGGPFYLFQMLVTVASGGDFVPRKVLAAYGGSLWLFQMLSALPVYAVILGIGELLRLRRNAEAKQLEAIDLQRSLAAAELAALGTQLQPQFLFQALSTVRLLAERGDTDAVSRAIERLGRVLRLSMEAGGRGGVALDEELALVGEYLSAEVLRLGPDGQPAGGTKE